MERKSDHILVKGDRSIQILHLEHNLINPQHRNVIRCGTPCLALGLPHRERTDEVSVRWIIEESDELKRVSVRVAKIKLRRWHPANHGRFGRFLPREISS